MATAVAAEVEELRERLRELQTAISQNLTKDISLVAGLKEWTGDSKGKMVQEYFAQIETFTKVSHWTEQDMALIAKAKLQGLALQFLNSKEELQKDSCTYGAIKKVFIVRFTDKLPDHYHYTQLQDAVQGKNESAEVLGGRHRRICHKTIRKVDDEATQLILNEEAECRLVAAYINGLRGTAGQQVKFRMPATMDEAVRLAVTIENAEQQKTPERRVFTTSQADITCYQ
jgi:D-lyxose ketol-isomerase